MPAVRLPADAYYVSVNKAVLRAALEKIEEQFHDLLRTGGQAVGLPPGLFAAGQYLNPYSINQRGLYGTSAALLVLARSAPGPDRIRTIEGIIRYVLDRENIELALVTSDTKLPALRGRLASEWKTTFKCAELLYALSVAPPAVNGREELLGRVLSKITAGRRSGGGWAVDLDPQREGDPLATASIVRALNAAGIPNDPIDIKLVREHAHDERNVSIYVRVFCLMVLLDVGGRDQELDALWDVFLEELAPQLRELVEANYEFTLSDHYHYVRLPWQLYLLSCAALRSPLLIITSQPIRRILLKSLSALNSSGGYVYAASGHMKSTRTYSILMDTLWRLDQTLTTARYTTPIFAVANWGARVVYSRAVTVLILLAAALIGGLSLWSWISNRNVPLSGVGPELFTAGMMAVVALLLRQLRRR